jgi:hypothetical protein
MSESVEEGTKSDESEPNPRQKFLAKQFRKGVSGNPSGRPRIEPRVRRYARTYDRAMCKVLAEIAQDEKAPMSERRKAAMDLIAVGSGRPELVQQITGRDGAPIGPLVALNFSAQQSGRDLSPSDAYKLMSEGVIEIDPKHPAFTPALEHSPTPAEGDGDKVTP